MRPSYSLRTVTRFIPLTSTTRPRREYRDLIRYWTLDLDVHKKRLRELRSAAGTENSRSVEERWQKYLDTAAEKRLTSEEVATNARRCWARIRGIAPTLQPPDASPTNSKGLLMSWDMSGRHLEVEILPDSSYEWFYRERIADIAEGGEQRDVETISEALASRLRHLTES